MPCATDPRGAPLPLLGVQVVFGGEGLVQGEGHGRAWSNEGLLVYDITRVQVGGRRGSVEDKQLEERLIMQDSQDPTQSNEGVGAMGAYLAEHNIDTFVDCWDQVHWRWGLELSSYHNKRQD